MVIVLLGIIAAASARFVQQAMNIYIDATGRDALQQQGRYAVERMSRELRSALPGSIRVNSNATIQCIEFMPIQAASTYLQPVSDTAITSLDVVDFSYSFTTGDLIAVYPVDASSVYATPSALGTLSAATSAVAGVQTLSLTAKQFPDESPVRRFYIVTAPISFCAADNALRRHQGYGRTVTQSPLPPNTGVLLAEKVRLTDSGSNVTVFSFSAGTLQRSGVVHMDLRFSDSASLGDEWVRFSQEVFVRNTP